MTGGITFGPGQIWLVSRSLSDPIIERVVSALSECDPALAEWVRVGIYMQSVSTRLLEPIQREKVRRAVVEVTRDLLSDDDLLRSVDRTEWGPNPVADGHRRQTVKRLLDIAESEEARRFTAGEAP